MTPAERIAAAEAWLSKLPDAEHIHITKLPDGTIKSAVPMVPLTVNACFMGGSTDCRLGGTPTAWVDSA